jgi:hypothetical protein
MAIMKVQREESTALTHHEAYKINFYLEKLTFAISAPSRTHMSTFSSMQLNQSSSDQQVFRSLEFCTVATIQH